MRLSAVCYLIAHPRCEDEGSAILEFGVQFAFEAQEDVAFAAPMVRQVAGGVFDHAHADVAKLLRPLCSNTSHALMFNRFDQRLISRAKWDVFYVHRKPLSMNHPIWRVADPPLHRFFRVFRIFRGYK